MGRSREVRDRVGDILVETGWQEVGMGWGNNQRVNQGPGGDKIWSVKRED